MLATKPQYCCCVRLYVAVRQRESAKGSGSYFVLRLCNPGVRAAVMSWVREPCAVWSTGPVEATAAETKVQTTKK